MLFLRETEVNKQQEELVLIICTPRRFKERIGRTILGPEENILSLSARIWSITSAALHGAAHGHCRGRGG
jgi:hypothetical protein